MLTLSTYVILVSFLLSTVHGDLYSLSYDFDKYGLRIASNDHFAVLARNDGRIFSIMMAPFGLNFYCDYLYLDSSNYVSHVAVGRNQNASQLSFVYLYTNSSTKSTQKLGLFRFSPRDTNNVTSTCQITLRPDEGEHEVKVWNEDPSEVSAIKVDPSGQ